MLKDNKHTLILMCDNRAPSGDISKYYNLAAYNNYLYAKSQGYAFKYLIPTTEQQYSEQHLVCKNPVTGSPRHAAWSKILAIYKELPNYSTVIYIDSDAYFNNTACVYERSGCKKVSVPIKFLKDIPWFGTANSGFIIVDNTPEAFRFLKKWYWSQEADNKYDTEHVFEQHYVQTFEDPAFAVLDIHQIKLNFSDDDLQCARPLINHVTGKATTNQYDIIYRDTQRMYGIDWFPEIMSHVEKISEKYSTDKTIASMGDAQVQLQAYCKSKVLRGPFSGLIIFPSTHWWGGDIMAKWLGTYEEPLHLALSSELSKKHDMFINVGCGDGYYGAGVGIKNKDCQLVLLDIAPECSELVRDICRENDITEYHFSRDSSAGKISSYLQKAKNPWMLMDIEGAESQLLDIAQIPELIYTTIIVEVHDFNVPDVTTILISRFEKTHYMVNISDTLTRNLEALPAHIELDQKNKELIRTEKRPVKMNWLYMLPR